MGSRAKDNPPRKRGPKPERLVLPGPWEETVSQALKKKKPAEGWPKPPTKKKGQEK